MTQGRRESQCHSALLSWSLLWLTGLCPAASEVGHRTLLGLVHLNNGRGKSAFYWLLSPIGQGLYIVLTLHSLVLHVVKSAPLRTDVPHGSIRESQGQQVDCAVQLKTDGVVLCPQGS